jgi:acetyltransferase-like isoleucine patch superfamily enzyme
VTGVAAQVSVGRLVRRFLLPSPLVSLIGFLRWRARISWRAEVELSSNLQLGPRNTISSFTKVKTADGVVRTGMECGFATGCFVAPGSAGIELGDHVVCGPNVAIVGCNYRYAALDVPFDQQGTSSLGVRIGRNVWIGSNSTILDGSVIGDNTIVVANSWVNRRFPPNVIVQGNPAKVVVRRGPGAGDSSGHGTGASARARDDQPGS